MGKKSAPPAPDYTQAAEQTAASSAAVTNQQTWANRANQVTPWGTQTWSSSPTIDPATGQRVAQWTQTTTLSPAQQQALDSQQAIDQQRSDIAQNLMGRVQQEYSTPMDWGQLTSFQNAPTAGNSQAVTNPMGFNPSSIDTSLNNLQTGAQNSSNAANAAYAQATSRLDPQWQHQQQDLETQLANQGISQNSDAYSRAMQQFQQQKTDAYNQANMSAIQAGVNQGQVQFGEDLSKSQQQLANTVQQQQLNLGQQQQGFQQQLAAQGQNYNQQLQSGTFNNQLRNQQLTDAMTQRGFSLNEIQALLNGQQIGMPSFSGYNTANASQATDYSGAAQNQYSAAMDAYNAQQATTNQLIGAAGNIGGAAMMFSDRRVKADVRRIGTHPRLGVGVYSYRYIGERGRRVGVMAQEVRRVAPHLVHSMRGVLMVDYAGLDAANDDHAKGARRAGL